LNRNVSNAIRLGPLLQAHHSRFATTIPVNLYVLYTTVCKYCNSATDRIHCFRFAKICDTTLWGKTTAPCYFCNISVKTFYSDIFTGTYILQQI